MFFAESARIPYDLVLSYMRLYLSSFATESEDIQKEIEYYKKHDLPFEVLRDGEVYFENGETKEFLRLG